MEAWGRGSRQLQPRDDGRVIQGATCIHVSTPPRGLGFFEERHHAVGEEVEDHDDGAWSLGRCFCDWVRSDTITKRHVSRCSRVQPTSSFVEESEVDQRRWSPETSIKFKRA